MEGLELEECDYSPTTPEEMEDEMEERFHQLKAISEKNAEEKEEEVAEVDPSLEVENEDEQETMEGKGKIPQRVRPDQPFALPNPHAPWPIVVPYGAPLHPDEPRSMGLVYLEDAERGREAFEREGEETTHRG